MEDFNQEFVYSFIMDSPDSPTLGIGKASSVAEIENWLQQSTLQPISPSTDSYDEGKLFTPMDNVEMDFLSQSIQNAGITSEFPQPVADFNLNSGALMNGNNPSGSVNSFNETPGAMGVQTSFANNDSILLSYDAGMISPGSSSPKVLSVSPHPQYLDQPGPSSVESTISVASNHLGAVKNGRKSRRRTRAPKKKLYEVEEPFDDPVEERKRLNAIKAHRNRQKKGGFVSLLETENTKLKNSLHERDMLIAELKKTILDFENTCSTNAVKLDRIRKILD